jgi:hypothetical protein
MKKILLSMSVLLLVGIAFSQQRMVLTESFSQASCGPCASQNPVLNALMAANPAKVVAVKYQVSWPGVDPMNAQNQTDVSARQGAYYNIQGVPDRVMDGTNMDVTQAAINARYAVPSLVNMTVSHVMNSANNTIDVIVTVTAPAVWNPSNTVMQLAMIERNITFTSAPGSNGETEFHNVMRKMLPSPNGTAITATNFASANGTQTFTFTGVPIPSYIYDLNEIGFVAWVQNNTTKEVYQAGYSWPIPPQSSSYLTGNATICAGNSTNLSVAVTGGTAPYTVTVTDGTNNFSATGASPVSIPVSPSATSTYSIVSVTGVGGTGNTGSATVTVTPVPTQPIVACYETATFNTTSCSWDLTGIQVTEPTGLACYEITTFNTTSCTWEVTGTQPAQPILACYQTAAFNTATCSWDVTGTQPTQPTLACYETAVFNSTTCAWVISGPQAPQKMSYQAVIRNSNDSLLISTPVGMRISLVQGTPSGTVVFSEAQTATTNSNGLVSLQIGMGTVVTGTFACIDWASGPYYVKTETDLTGGANYTIISSNELMSVPYALFSANGPTGVQGPAGPQGPIGLTGANGIYSTPTYTIGLWPELGGYVFRISSDGKHGLVSETIDQGCANYGTLVQDNISNPLNHSIDGAKFMDWRTPTKYEAQEMYLQRNAIGNFLSQWYWTSIALYGGSNYYWQQNFSNIQIWGPDNSGYGDFGNGACPINGLIRSVRSF